MNRKTVRWLPVAVVPVVIAAGVLIIPSQAGAAVTLPDKSAQQVLELIQNSTVRQLSGEVTQTSALGLPALPTGAGAPALAPGASTSDLGASVAAPDSTDATQALELLTGSHTARVYLDGDTKSRVQIMDQLAERDAVRNGSDVWFYDSKKNAVTHLTLPAGFSAAEAQAKAAAEAKVVMTPTELAKKFLAKIDPSTTVSVGQDTRVAGRTAYTLVLTPRTTDTLVGSVAITTDSETGLPLSVSVEARGQKDPAFSVAFTTVTIGAPDAALFRFTPPAGATVKEQALPALPDAATVLPNGTTLGDLNPGTMTGKLTPEQLNELKAKLPAGTPVPVVTGTSWDAVVSLPAGTVPAELTGNKLFTAATSAVEGGRLASSALLNVLFTTDGRVFAGAVPLERLQAVAATK
ncbi:MAG: DUF2092 domain-containing protein [Microbacteriaceae bacterium]|nr:DUF2092 domain-containing protein [Microbacteriaceae bacterium]